MRLLKYLTLIATLPSIVVGFVAGMIYVCMGWVGSGTTLPRFV